MSKKNSTKKTKVILAVGYCRKSTDDETTEKSIADQISRIKKLRPLDENAEYKIVRWYTQDLGIQGWKRGARRPDFFKLVNELKETGATAILVDDMDRFSRAEDMEVVADVQDLRAKHGIKYIHAANQGLFELVNDPYLMMKIGMAAMASHEHSKRLSRRITHTRKDKAEKGLRSGGPAPYGMVNEFILEGDKKKFTGMVIPGNPELVKIVRWIFHEFVDHVRSLGGIVKDLNQQGIKTRHGKLWEVQTVKDILSQKAYRGDFVYNQTQSGQFNKINSHGEVTEISQYEKEKNEAEDAGKVYNTKNVYKPLVDPKLFDGAQKRLASFAKKSMRPREAGYALTGVLYCGHCHERMYGCFHREQRVYRCSSSVKFGKEKCGTYWVREDDILPFVLEQLGKEISKLETKLESPKPPVKLKNQDDKKQEIEKQLAQLKLNIERATKNLMLADDRTRPVMDSMVKELWAERDALEIQLATDPTETEIADQREAYQQLKKWWADSLGKTGYIPLPNNPNAATKKIYGEDGRVPFFITADYRQINEALMSLGGMVTLQWNHKKWETSTGKTHQKYTLAKIRLQLGEQAKDVTLCKLLQTTGTFF